jgi:outer membrane protein assembly factor BamB
MTHQRFAGARRATLVLGLAIIATAAATASDWPDWRGPLRTGVSDDSGLVSSWSVEGENLIWHQPFIGRSTPVVFDGRVCAVGRVGADRERQETVACWSAETGKLLWERRYPVFNTTVPFSRVGWGGPAIDPETGNLYAQLVDGRFVALGAEGETLWERRLREQFGRLSGYGGRTHTPLVDEDKVIISLISISWGELAAPRHRYYAFDKRTGEVLWTSTPGTVGFEDANTQGTPTLAEIAGRRLMIGGGADGWVYALESRTGKLAWKFNLSERGLHTTPVVDGTTVYVAHSEENVDTRRMGRVVAIDGTGSGDVTATHEKWRVDDLLSGFPSPAFHEGRLYVADNSANLYALDGETGELLWTHDYGTVGKASPVLADGKLYITQVNGDVVIIEPGDRSAKTLDVTHIEVEDGRYAEIYASPAVAYGRVYIATEAGVYAIGDPARPFAVSGSSHISTPGGEGEPAALRVVPAEEVAQPGDSVAYRAETLDAKGRVIGRVEPGWSLDGLTGELGGGALKLPADSPGQAGKVVAKLGDLTATGRLRVGASVPFSEDFSSGRIPSHWIGGGRFKVEERGGDNRLHKAPAERGFQRGTILMSPPSATDYSVQADILGLKRGRRQPDIGIMNGGYAMELLGPHQELRVNPWAAEEAGFATRVPFEWAPDTWYTMKLVVDYEGGEAVARGRVWKTGDPEPEGWAVEAHYPLPIREGSPGLTCDSGVDVYYDNVKVMSR